MTEIRETTQVRRMRTLKVYTLEPSVTAVPCLANGVAKEDNFVVSLYLSENNKDRAPHKAMMRYKRCRGQSCEAAVTSSAAVDSIRVETGKTAGKVFDKYVIEAFEIRDKKETVLATLQVQTVLDGAQGQAGSSGPMLVPYGSWEAGRTYRSTSDVKIFVERHKQYYVLAKLDTDCKGVDPATDTKNQFWRLMDYLEYVFVNAMVAEFGKIGSAVFSGDYTISQYGVDDKGNPVNTESGYENFGKKTAEGKDLFTPNIAIDWLSGRIRALEMIIAGNSRFGGTLEAVTGTFRSLRCTSNQQGSDGRPEEIDGGSIEFFPMEDRGVIGIIGDMYQESGLLGVYSKFYTESLLCKGVFSARMRTVMMVTGDRAVVYKDGVYSDGYEIQLMASLVNNTEKYYTLPCFHAQMPIAGLPIDTIVFCVPPGQEYNYELDMFDSQRVLVVNTHQQSAVVRIYTLGGRRTVLDSGEVRELVKMRTLTKPGQASRVGNGLYAGPFHINEWL